MEKLLKLLNEYKPLGPQKEEYCIEGTELYIKTRIYAEVDNYLNYTTQVISKKFWFIQWLVLGSKIDTDELIKHWYVVKTHDLDELWDNYSYEDSLLMLLAIQDDPISFLISILK